MSYISHPSSRPSSHPSSPPSSHHSSPHHSYSYNTPSRFHRTGQSDVLTAAIKVLTDNIIEDRKNTNYHHISQLYENTHDLCLWLDTVDKTTRDNIYNEWITTRRPNSERIRNSIVIRYINDCITLSDIYKPKDDKGFVFVDFEDSLSVAIAIRELHKVQLNNQIISVELSKSAFTSRNDLSKSTTSSKSGSSTPKSRSISPIEILSTCDSK
jgi:hypothetical protein